MELTDREIQLLAYMMEIQAKLTNKDTIKSIIATPIRKQIFKELGISKSNYINYLKTYRGWDKLCSGCLRNKSNTCRRSLKFK